MTLSQKNKSKNESMAWGMAQVVEHLPGKLKMSSNSSTPSPQKKHANSLQITLKGTQGQKISVECLPRAAI
jgi:hypothetical protein